MQICKYNSSPQKALKKKNVLHHFLEKMEEHKQTYVMAASNFDFLVEDLLICLPWTMKYIYL